MYLFAFVGLRRATRIQAGGVTSNACNDYPAAVLDQNRMYGDGGVRDERY